MLIALLVLLLSSLVLSNAAAAPIELTDCKVGEAAARCAKFPVFENRDSMKGRKIELNVVVLPSTSATPARDAVVFVAGGPGDASTSAARSFLDSPLRAERDFVFVDQRGTGGSNPLRCSYQDEPGRASRYLADFMPADGLRKCAAELRTKADLRFYTTPYAAADLDELRAALGYESLNLIGASYGTRFALSYMRQFPDRARTAILYGPSPTDHSIPFTTAIDAEQTLEGLLADCTTDPVCRERFPDTRSQLTTILDQLGASPKDVTVRDPMSGAETAVVMNRAAFAQAVRYMLYRPSSAARVPLAVDLASRGDFSEAASFALVLGSAFNRDPDGLYAAITCAEDVPFVEPSSARLLANGTFLGMERVNSQREVCRTWPKANLSPSYRDAVKSKTPTLLIVGERDPATPVRLARAIAASLSNSRVVVVRDGMHSLDGLQQIGCLERVEASFIPAASLDAADTGCAATAVHPPFVLQTERDRMITMTEAQLQRFAGTFEGDGLSLIVEPAAPGIVAAVGTTKLNFIPVGELEFAAEGGVGISLRFEEADGRMTAVRIIEGSGEGMRLPKKN